MRCIRLKKIVFVIGVLSNGGAERVISILANEMSNKGYDVHIITIYEEKNDYIEDYRISIYTIKHNKSNKLLRGIDIIKGLRQYLRQINPDVVVSFVAKVNIYTIISNMFMSNKLVVSERNDPYQNPENRLLRTFRNFLYRYVDGIVFQTRDAKGYFSKSIQRKSTIIPNPIKPNLPYWSKENKPSNKKIITACRLSRQKNLPMLINAFNNIKKDYPNIELYIYGIGSMKRELESMIENLNLTDCVKLPGFSNNIHQEMANASLFVISSNYEGISNSMLEALAIGVPVISTDSPIGGAKMFIKNGINGILVDVGDTKGLEVAMKNILSDKQLSIKLSYESRKIREYLTHEKIMEQWLNFINLL